MSNLRAIKEKIQSVKKTHQVTKAMEAVSGVKMRKSQLSALVARPYAMAAFRILSRITRSVNIARHPLVEVRPVHRVLLVVVTSDKGLAGGLNSGITKCAVAALQERAVSKENVGILAIGRKGEDFFARRGYILEKHIEALKDESSIGDFEGVVSLVTKLFTEGKYDECLLVYTNFRSTFEQEPVSRTLLPLSVEGLTTMIKGIVPEKGAFAEVNANFEKEEVAKDYLFEPSPEAVFDSLLPKLLAIEIYHAFIESKASEHSARMVAMRNASDKAEEVTFDLTREYNKARQSAITREMSEIIGGIEAMK
ncbi:MAG: ATP synthase F1 subunit gamma [Candidatus Paceibacterota bacterium]|jgi:F-type H+-transporting ATPase subunit gamma